MKFAKELEEGLVPEWRAKYLDYKVGKKKLKAATRALRGLNASPRAFRGWRPGPETGAGTQTGPKSGQIAPIARDAGRGDGSLSADPLIRDNARGSKDSEPTTASDPSASGEPTTLSASQPAESVGIDAQQTGPDRLPRRAMTYGSIGSIPQTDTRNADLHSLELPAPALQTSLDSSHPTAIDHTTSQRSPRDGRTRQSSKPSMPLSPVPQPRRSVSNPPDISRARPFLQKLLAPKSPGRKNAPRIGTSHSDIHLEAYREFDARKEQFFTWMDKELEKIETFYKEKEDEAGDRLDALRAQLHEMRNRRLDEVLTNQKTREKLHGQTDSSTGLAQDHSQSSHVNGSSHIRFPHLPPVLSNMKPKSGSPHGKNTKALQNLGSPAQNHLDSHRDFVRRQHPDDGVPYRQAKRKLKAALAEYYRALELLKSYALLNRTAFRKINKKYDKAAQARQTGRYMSEKVNKAYFVQSAVLDEHIQTVEDLYARYFERGNHKVAVGKLRSKNRKPGEFYGSVHRNGLMLGAGLVFGVQGLVYGSQLLGDPDPVIKTQTSYLLQIYGGYFLAVLLFLLFCLDCRIWTEAKINYVFIFEYDTRHHLDWRQLSELPCFFVLLEGLFMWINFQRLGAQVLFIYYPVILIGLTMIFLCFPARALYHHSRLWWLHSNWRLLLAGLYPVEFRDFFLGDQYCSQTYAMGNIELFFCLYAQHWSNPVLCNSSHSRLLGFFQTLPGIWRGLQCLRRFYDTRNIFPHLVNGGKYAFTILFYMSLSLYRINKTHQMEAFFIFCATINSVYCSIWDLGMDWSLGNPYAKHPFLRDVLGYKRPAFYYLAMFLDPILRFNWIFYIIYENDLQHSAVLSFFVNLSEVLRRGMWSLFRVENEHCTNVGRFRASRDVPLPYNLKASLSESRSSSVDDTGPEAEIESRDERSGPSRQHTRSSNQIDITAEPDLEQGQEPPTESPKMKPKPSHSPSLLQLRLRKSRSQTSPEEGAAQAQAPKSPSIGAIQTSPPIQSNLARVGTLITTAHAQDFERKRRRPTQTSPNTAATDESRPPGTPGAREGRRRSILFSRRDRDSLAYADDASDHALTDEDDDDDDDDDDEDEDDDAYVEYAFAESESIRRDGVGRGNRQESHVEGTGKKPSDSHRTS